MTKSELDQLIWLLNAGEDHSIALIERTHGYKLGAAKPLGLGSIAIKTEEVVCRKVKAEKERVILQRMKSIVPTLRGVFGKPRFAVRSRRASDR